MQMESNSGKRETKGWFPTHLSIQNRIVDPVPTEIKEPKRNTGGS